MERKVQEALGGDNREIVKAAIDKLEAGDAEGLGRLMTTAQKLFVSTQS